MIMIIRIVSLLLLLLLLLLLIGGCRVWVFVLMMMQRTIALFFVTWTLLVWSERVQGQPQVRPLAGAREGVDRPPLDIEGEACSRRVSRLVRNLLQSEVFPLVEEREYNLSEACPLHWANDRYHVHEKAKESVRGRQWRCRLCEKTFKSEYYLDKHFHNRHEGDIPESATTCLADYCDVFMCQGAVEEDGMGETRVKACKPQEIEKTRFLCQALLHKCFPPEDGEIAQRLLETLTATYCDVLVCPADPEEFLATREALQKKRKPAGFLYKLVAGAVGVFMLVFYLVVWLYRRKQGLGSDLKRLASARHALRLQFLRGHKVKAY